MSPRGGRRPGAGAKPRGDVAMTKMLRAPATPALYEWAHHVAEASGMSVAEWLRSLADREIGEHECAGCSPADRASPRSRGQ